MQPDIGLVEIKASGTRAGGGTVVDKEKRKKRSYLTRESWEENRLVIWAEEVGGLTKAHRSKRGRGP